MKHLMRYEGYTTQQRVDDLLDKISNYGINSLNKLEKDFLDAHKMGKEEEVHNILTKKESECTFEDDSGMIRFEFDKIEKGGTLTQFKGYMFRPDGIYQFTKELKKINYKIVDRKLIADTIPEISDILFGKNYPYAKWNTYEKTLALLTATSQSTNPKLNMPLILKEYRAKLAEEGLVIPGGID